jgi:hypothetical protein
LTDCGVETPIGGRSKGSCKSCDSVRRLPIKATGWTRIGERDCVPVCEQEWTEKDGSCVRCGTDCPPSLTLPITPTAAIVPVRSLF